MTLKELLEKQDNLMKAIRPAYRGAYCPYRPEAREIEKVHELIILTVAKIDEDMELLREFNWKPWKKQTKILNREAIISELCDAWHFMLEKALLLNVTAEELEAGLEKTFQKNHERVKNGY